MARIIEMVQTVAMDNQPGAVGGVGQMFFSPNSRNVLPGKVVFTVDIRTPDQDKLDGMRARIEAEAPKICEALGVGCSVEPVGHFDPVTFDPALRQGACATPPSGSATATATSSPAPATMPAGPTKVAPTTMVMCPCVDGLSHNEAEDIIQGMGDRRRRRPAPRRARDGGDRCSDGGSASTRTNAARRWRSSIAPSTIATSTPSGAPGAPGRLPNILTGVRRDPRPRAVRAYWQKAVAGDRSRGRADAHRLQRRRQGSRPRRPAHPRASTARCCRTGGSSTLVEFDGRLHPAPHRHRPRRGRGRPQARRG